MADPAEARAVFRMRDFQGIVVVSKSFACRFFFSVTIGVLGETEASSAGAPLAKG